MNDVLLAELKHFILWVASIGGVAISALVAWLGSIWAQRILQAERGRQDRALEEVKATLKADVDARVAVLNNELGFLRDRLIGEHRFMTDTYVKVAEPFIAILGTVPSGGPAHEDWKGFERDRLRAYATLALIAAQEVLSAFDAMVDYLFDVRDGRAVYGWQEVRTRALNFLNEARRQVLAAPNPIQYLGHR
jgi:hypothetical protein